jgi:hypothetical protein
MSNPYEENPQTQPSPQSPYGQPGQYPAGGQQPSPYGQQSPMPYDQQSPAPYDQQSPTPYGQQPQMPYGQQPYGAPPEHPQGTLILIFGIVGIFITIFAPIAWYLGNKAKKEIQASGMQYSNEQNISIGRMLGKIFTIIAIVWIAFVIVWIVIALIAAGQSG